MTIPTQLRRGLRLPVIGAPLFIISNPELVIAQCTAGIIGAMPSLNARDPWLLTEALTRIVDALAAHDAAHPDRPAAPYAVNLIIHSSNLRLEEDIAICARFKVPLVITSLGARADVNDAVHGWGGLVFHDVTTQHFARKAVDKGADGLVLIGAGAGGHTGAISPFALMSETRAWYDGPVALGGAISTGEAILAAQALGADFAYIGSPFIATAQAHAPDAQKQAIVQATAADIVGSDHFTGIAANYLRDSIRALGLDPDHLPAGSKSSMDFSSATDAKAWRDVWSAGQGVGAVRAVESAAVLIERLARDHARARARLRAQQ